MPGNLGNIQSAAGECPARATKFMNITLTIKELQDHETNCQNWARDLVTKEIQQLKIDPYSGSRMDVRDIRAIIEKLEKENPIPKLIQSV